ncbi:hypothetical protein CR970_02140 [Candidatus Saccharibacteria bacterium]|nr:MAG: hypothetical protein CR970_02140 [Candidatus Saccharibacteria bacterium]
MERRNRIYLSGNTTFYIIIVFLAALAGIFFDHPHLAMWFGFAVAGYAAVSNDSIQTLGTFLSSNRKVDWRLLWLFIGGIMVVTVTYGWLTYNGDISFHRLSAIPQPQQFSFLQILAPVVLIVLTKYKFPVSTTFLILATFSSSKTIQGMLEKTFFGYVLAFVLAFVVWGCIGYIVNRNRTKIERKLTKRQERRWRVFQWLSTGFLWSAWLAQDNANAAVFLPREISFEQLLIVLVFMVSMIGFTLYRRGGEIQDVITEKTDTLYVKSATAIDFVYAVILVYFKWLNHLPMSTTWVFLGLLAGREIALRATIHKDQPYSRTLRLVKNDLLRAGFGLGVSLALALFANSHL